MKTNTIIGVLALLFFFTVQTSFAEEIEVGLEPLPPLIVDESTGLSVQLLKEVEKISDLTFSIKIMPYNRAKAGLKSGKLSLMGHTPHGQEVEAFYAYAQELEWSVPTNLDIFATDKNRLKPEVYKTLEPIGTPRGNKEFIAEVFGIPVDNFYEGSIDNLLKMLKMGRIEAFAFERASTMSTIKDLNLDGIYYKHGFDISAGFAVPADSSGTRLKEKLDSLIKKVDQEAIFKEYLDYMSLPKTGEVTF